MTKNLSGLNPLCFLPGRVGTAADQTLSQPCLDMLADERRRSEIISCQERFATTRRSLSIWPVQGNTDQEIQSNALHFLCEKMRVPDHEEIESKLMHIRRVRQTSKSGVHFEVLLIFSDKIYRDLVLAKGRYLADFTDVNGLPTAGTRID